MSHPLVINGLARANIRDLIAYAEAHPVSRRQLARVVELVDPPVGADPLHSVAVPVGFQCTYSVEEQPAGLSRHLSVSVETPGRWPSPEAMALIMAEFGFTRAFVDGIRRMDPSAALGVVGTLYMERAAEAINVVERIT